MDYKRKKDKRQRGSKTHGWGSMKKHRGAGNRGGKGMAGTGKRGDANKPNIWKNKKYFGKHGFKSIKTKLNSINISDIENNLENYLKKGLIKEEKGVYVVNLSDLGYEKVLGNNKITKSFKITAFRATKKAIEKVKEAKGEIIVLDQSESEEIVEG